MFKHSLPAISPLSPLSLHFVTRIPALSGLKRYGLLCLVMVCSLIPIASNAQDTIKRPKIGLVLSGGGAKGLAHIGVLKEIEKAGIKIDYIGGTSMGAIVGGLYAVGYTAHELDSIFNGTNFDELLQDFVPRNNKNFYEKANDEVYALTLPFQNLKISVPRGISKGLYNYNLISKLTHNVRYINDFSKLKIPFLCIATNVETGEEVVFKKGSLPLVLTASGAFPSLFSPVEIDGKYYIDGGVTNNYPVEEVRKMGADIIIGVDVQDDLKSSDKIKGATGVLSQISSFQMLEKMKEKKLLTDIYIKPNIDGFSVISFERGKALVSKGVEAAQLVEDKLKALGTNYHPVSQQSKTTDTLNIKSVVVFGLQDYTQSYVLGKLRFKKEKKISYVDLNSGINNLNATQNFSSINYKLVKQNETQDNLILEVRENPVKTFIKLGLHYDDLFKSGLLLNITKKNLLFKNDVAAFDLILGDNIRYNLDYYVDNGFHWSFGFKSKFKQFNKNSKTDYYEGNLLQILGINSINVDYMDLSNQAYLQTIFAQKFLIGAGVEHKYLKISTNSTQIATTYFDRSHYLSAVGFLKYDSFDNKYFPKSGWYFMGDFQSYISSTDYNSNFTSFSTFKGDVGIAQTFFKKFAVKLQSEAGFNVDRNKNNVFDYQLGGYGFSKINNIKSFYGYDFLELSGNTYIKGSATLDYEFLKKNHFNFVANYANLGANIFADGEWLSKPKYTGYAIGYGLETYIGPIEIKHSWSPETKNHYTWFSVGFWF